MTDMTVKEMASLGGHARAAKLTKERLSKIGTKAVTTRWRKAKHNKQREEAKWKNKKPTRRNK
jgi:hypothetical protein